MLPRKSPMALVAAYAAALLAVSLLDAFWHGFAARDFYVREMGFLVRNELHLAPAVLFYALYPAGLVYLVLQARPASTEDAAFHGSVIGLLSYGAYDLTNLASIPGWSATWSILEIGWGTFMSSVASAMLCWAYRAWDDSSDSSSGNGPGKGTGRNWAACARGAMTC
jgi:uncharacterized membrane protein